MLVFCTFVNIEVTKELCTKLILRKHTLHYTTEQLVSTVRLSHDACRSVFTLTTRIASVSKIDTISPLLTSKLNLIGIDDNNVVTTIYVRSKVGFILTAQQFGNLCTKTTQNLISSIYYYPFFLCSLFVSRNGLVT